MIIKNIRKRMINKLSFLYGEQSGYKILNRIEKIIEFFLTKYPVRYKDGKEWVDEKDIILITYGDQIKEGERPPLESLGEFLNEYVKEVVNSIHILPFYPYSSDDGFSVTNYFKVNPELGKWKNIKKISENFDLMLDAVVNHISAKSEWFKGYLEGNEEYKKFFIDVDCGTDLSSVTRPRNSLLLTRFKTFKGEKYIWTTFSGDQVDLNYKNEKVLLKVIELLLFYIGKGARFIRLDAAGYIWKEIGTKCINLAKTHKIVQLFRDVLEIVAPEVILITETNVAHKDNIGYFGNGYNESHMVYQFPLPPLVSNAFYKGDADHLSKWIDSLDGFSKRTAFFNFLASHDGIGIMPVWEILSREEVDEMVKKVKARGGAVSYRDNGDGTKSIYELNINYLDALSELGEEEDLKVKRFICSQAILSSLAGVPGIYIHSLIGSRNHQKIKRELQKHKDIDRRSINREKFGRKNLEEELRNPDNLRYKVFAKYKELIKRRTGEKAFHPNGEQRVILENKHIFALLRTSVDDSERIVCLHNVSSKIQVIKIKPEKVGFQCLAFRDIISGKVWKVKVGILKVALAPYEILWLKAVIENR